MMILAERAQQGEGIKEEKGQQKVRVETRRKTARAKTGRIESGKVCFWEGKAVNQA